MERVIGKEVVCGFRWKKEGVDGHGGRWSYVPLIHRLSRVFHAVVVNSSVEKYTISLPGSVGATLVTRGICIDLDHGNILLHYDVPSDLVDEADR